MSQLPILPNATALFNCLAGYPYCPTDHHEASVWSRQSRIKSNRNLTWRELDREHRLPSYLHLGLYYSTDRQRKVPLQRPATLAIRPAEVIFSTSKYNCNIEIISNYFLCNHRELIKWSRGHALWQGDVLDRLRVFRSQVVTMSIILSTFSQINSALSALRLAPIFYGIHSRTFE